MKNIQLNKKQKLVAIIGVAIGVMILLHLFVFTPRIRQVNELRGRYGNVQQTYTQIQQKQKPSDVLGEYIAQKDVFIQNIENSVEHLMLYDPPLLEGEEPPGISVGFENSIHSKDSKENIYSVLIEKYHEIRDLAQNSNTTQINVVDNWRLEEELVNFDPNVVADLLHRLRVEYQIIQRDGVSEAVLESSRREALRLRRELGFNMRLLNQLDDYLELLQKMIYVKFLEEHKPGLISMSELITYLDVNFPDDQDGGLLVGFQALLEYTKHVMRTSVESGVSVFESLNYKEIKFDAPRTEREERLDQFFPGMFPGMGPEMDPRMFMGPEMMMDPAMFTQQERREEPEEEEEPLWERANALEVDFDIEFIAGNNEGMEFLSRLTNGPGFFRINSLNISTTGTDNLLFRANISNYAWINLKDSKISERGF